jgi:hypothetical protein
MKAKKTFDCVDMKDKIQESLYSRRKNMPAGDVRADIEHNLMTSEAPVALWWRKLKSKDSKRRTRSLATH